MKKILSISMMAVALTALNSCNKTDELFDKSAAERLNETKSLYTQRLCASPNGWAMQYYPTNENESPKGRGYLMLCKFKGDATVTVAMNNTATNNYYKEHTSLWDILTDDGPVLSFNSYNEVLHTFSTPELLDKGRGYEGDYEFIVVDAPADASYLMLKGKKRGTYNLLTPLEDGVDYEEYLLNVRQFQNKMFASDAPTFNVIHFGDSIYKMEDANDGVPNIYPYNGDKVMDESFNPFLITRRGGNYYLRFRDKHKVTEQESVQDFRYNTEKDVFESVDNTAYYISGDQPSRFFTQTIRSGSNNEWNFNRTSSMGTSFKTMVDNINRDLGRSKPKLTLTKFRLLNYEGKFCLDIQHKQGQADSHAYYAYEAKADASGITLSDPKPFGKDSGELEKSTNMYSAMASIKTLVDALAQRYVLAPEETAFNLKRLKFTSETDAEQWVILELLITNTDVTE